VAWGEGVWPSRLHGRRAFARRGTPLTSWPEHDERTFMSLSETESGRHRAALRMCVADLRASGVDLSRPGAAAVLVREHLDYFQLMIGGRGAECPAPRIVSMLRAEIAGASPAARQHPVH
jgi:hypothetical protein